MFIHEKVRTTSLIRVLILVEERASVVLSFWHCSLFSLPFFFPLFFVSLLLSRLRPSSQTASLSINLIQARERESPSLPFHKHIMRHTHTHAHTQRAPRKNESPFTFAVRSQS